MHRGIITSSLDTITVFQKMNLNVFHAGKIQRVKERVKRRINPCKLVRRTENFYENIQSF